jgi:hypothetical protein
VTSLGRDPSSLRETIQGEFLFQSDPSSPWATILFKFNAEGVESDEDEDEEDSGDRILTLNGYIELIRVNHTDNIVETFPTRKFPDERFPTHKYLRIHKISLEGFGFLAPQDPDEVAEMLVSFPTGLIQNPDYGLGLRKEYRFIVEAIENAEKINHLQISKNKPTAILQNTYVLNLNHYNALRKAINNTHTLALNNARVEKNVLAYNSLLHETDGVTYPERHRPYRPDTIFRATRGETGEKLSDKDQLAAVTLVEESKNTLVKKHPQKLVQLQHDLELTTLKELIETMDTMLGKNLQEAKWQEFFVEYPFVLSLAFALPIIVIQGQVSVGGRSFSGKGEKIADFLVKNQLTGNLALVEIKTPQTNILGKQYRHSVYPLSQDLVSCITQTLDQRHKLQGELHTKKANSGMYDIEAYAVRCLVVVGTTPKAADQKKSFELARNNLHDVIVVTFNELLEKLQHIYSFLSTEP